MAAKYFPVSNPSCNCRAFGSSPPNLFWLWNFQFSASRFILISAKLFHGYSSPVIALPVTAAILTIYLYACIFHCNIFEKHPVIWLNHLIIYCFTKTIHLRATNMFPFSRTTSLHHILLTLYWDVFYYFFYNFALMNL